MKNYILPLLIALFAFVGHVNAQTSYSMVVEKNDGGKVTIPTADIKQISFEENTNNPSLFQGPKRVFGNNQLKAMERERNDRYEFTYNEKGYVTKIHCIGYYTEDCIFEYNSDGIIITRWRDGYLDETTSINIGKNGFASGLSRGTSEYIFAYNDENQLINLTRNYIKEGEKKSKTMKLTWKNSNIVQSTNWHSGENYTPTYISYSTPTTDAIENVAGVMEYDNGMGFEVDDFNLLYYAGLLGKGTKHLPQAWSCDGTGKNTWTLDSAGRAIKLINEHKDSSSSIETEIFYWEW